MTNSKNTNTKTTKRRKGAKATTAPTVVLRKSMDTVDHMGIVQAYTDGVLTVTQIAENYKTTPKNVGLIVNRHWKSLTNMRESRMLLQAPESAQEHFDTKHAMAQLHSTDLINQEFLDKLSDPESELLSDEEATYAWCYVHTGDGAESVKTAGLDIGLIRDKSRDTRFSYDKALDIRKMYLNAKPNVGRYVTQLREERLIDADVGKSRIQSELITQIDQMKASGQANKNRMAMLRSIELLGKTVGAFVERVEITEVNPSDALDELIEMAKQAEVKPLPTKVAIGE